MFTDLPPLLDQFHQFPPRYRKSAIAGLAPIERSAAEQAGRKVRIALAENLPPDAVLQTALDGLEHLPAPELLPLVHHFQLEGQKPSPTAITGIDQALHVGHEQRNAAQGLGAASLHRHQNFGTEEQLQQIVVLLSDNGDVDASVWLACFQPVAGPLSEAIVERLRNADMQLNRDALVSYAVRLIQRTDTPNRTLSAEALVFASPARLVALAEELTVQESRQIAEQLHQSYSRAPSVDRAAGRSAELPESLQQLQPWSDRYHGVYCEQVLLLAGIPQAEWPQLDAVATQAGAHLDQLSSRSGRSGGADRRDFYRRRCVWPNATDDRCTRVRGARTSRPPACRRHVSAVDLGQTGGSRTTGLLARFDRLAEDEDASNHRLRSVAERNSASSGTPNATNIRTPTAFGRSTWVVTEDLEATASSAENRGLKRLEINPIADIPPQRFPDSRMRGLWMRQPPSNRDGCRMWLTNTCPRIKSR